VTRTCGRGCSTCPPGFGKEATWDPKGESANRAEGSPMLTVSRPFSTRSPPLSIPRFDGHQTVRQNGGSSDWP
jgi:hypothetical protein